MIELVGGDESLIEYVKDRPGHDRRYSLSSEKLKRELGWEAAGPLRRGDREDRRLVPRQRGVVGPDPLRRVPRVLRTAVRQGARLMAQRAGDEARRASSCSSRRSTATSAASSSRPTARDTWAELGVDAEFVQHNHSRSSQGHPARPPLPDRAGPGEAGPLPARRDPRRRRRPAHATRPPTGSGRATSSTTRSHRQLFVPVGFGHGFVVLSEVADVTYLLSSDLRPG